VDLSVWHRLHAFGIQRIGIARRDEVKGMASNVLVRDRLFILGL
jgi:hypothetical protein